VWALNGGGGVPLHLGIRQNDVSKFSPDMQLDFGTGVKDEDRVCGFGRRPVAAAKEEYR
jgi:hypothetical protein